MINIETIKQLAHRYFYRLNHGTGPRHIQHFPQEETDVNDTVKVFKKSPLAIHIVLFIITLFTISWAGGQSGNTIREYLISGLPYSITLIVILLSHEMGHYFAAQKFGVIATLPYFIPFPSLIGTMGAVIKTKSPIPHKKALFYIGAMGPVPGFILSLAAAVYGIYVSDIKPIPVTADNLHFIQLGDSLIFMFIVKIIHGPIAQGYDIVLSPYAWAGWIGFLITGINLMPLGQLDGAHILYSLIGRKQRYVGWAALGGLVVLSYIWYGWIIWIAITLILLMVAHPDVPEGEKLTGGEKILGWACMVILVLTFVPVPVSL